MNENCSLKPYNTFGIDARARYFDSFIDINSLSALLERFKNEKHLILGGGSNILLMNNFDGVVLKNEVKGIEVVSEDDEHIYIKAGAGENWHYFVQHCINHNYSGIENLSLIPGNVGASPMQNIGAYGVEIKDSFYQLEAWHIREGRMVTFTNKDCEFGYRESVFKKHYRGMFVILNVTFRLSKIPHFNTSYGAIEEELKRMHISELSIRAISDAVINIRRSKLPDPTIIGNAGSFFKNPEVPDTVAEQLKQGNPSMPQFKIDEHTFKIPAAWLIEHCGWKGYRRGDAGCHQKQPLVLVNYGNASGKDIYNLSSDIVKSVQEKFGVQLEREVNIIS
jgi:UDP-N-acetylmuramate dehydrogenase